MTNYDYVLAITDNTSGGTVTLTSAPFDVRGYAPRAGGRADATVGESAEIRLRDGSTANNLDELRKLQRLLQQANERQDHRALPKVYLTWKESASGDIWRSEIKEARAEWLDTALNRAYWVGDTQFASTQFERVNYWEGPEAQVALTNGNGTATLAALNVFNCNDGTGASPNVLHNYADIAGTAIAGDLPGATRLEMTNTYATASVSQVYIGQSIVNPTALTHILESSAATGGSVIASAGRSGGSYVSRSLASGSEADLFSWTISAAQIDAAAGREFKAIARFANTTLLTSVRFRLRLAWSGNTLWDSNLKSLDSGMATVIRDLMTFPLPPWLPGITSQAALTLTLRGYQASGAPVTVDVDFLQITPTDGWRYLRTIQGGAAQNRRIVDDGINEVLYTDAGDGTAKVSNFAAYSAPLVLYPNRNQRLVFLQSSTTADTAEIDRSLAVKLFYRPRRLTL